MSPFDGFWFLFSIEKKLALTAVGGYAINNRKNEIYYKDLKKGKTNMLKVENNRFYYGGISFPVPNGLYIDSCPPFIPRNGLVVYSEDRSICIALCFCEYEEPIPLYMDNADYNHKDYVTMPITKYEVNGITWYCRIFTYKKTQMFEAYLDTNQKDNQIYLDITVEIPKGRYSMPDVFELQSIKALFSDIRKSH